MDKTLTLNLKSEYWRDILWGRKVWEYRLVTPYWTRRLKDERGRYRTFKGIMLCRGYPATEEWERRIWRKWRGVKRMIITHPHFGPDPVQVYAIRVNPTRMS